MLFRPVWTFDIFLECHDVAAEDLSMYWEELSSSKDLKRRKFSPVGKVFPGGVNVAILDEDNNSLPVGVPGEVSY